jgi:hypothetical protein
MSRGRKKRRGREDVSCRRVFGMFLNDHPEWRDSTREHPEHGLMLTTEAMVAFANWCQELGVVEPKRASDFRKFLWDAARKFREGRQ